MASRCAECNADKFRLASAEEVASELHASTIERYSESLQQMGQQQWIPLNVYDHLDISLEIYLEILRSMFVFVRSIAFKSQRFFLRLLLTSATVSNNDRIW